MWSRTYRPIFFLFLIVIKLLNFIAFVLKQILCCLLVKITSKFLTQVSPVRVLICEQPLMVNPVQRSIPLEVVCSTICSKAPVLRLIF